MHAENSVKTGKFEIHIIVVIKKIPSDYALITIAKIFQKFRYCNCEFLVILNNYHTLLYCIVYTQLY